MGKQILWQKDVKGEEEGEKKEGRGRFGTRRQLLKFFILCSSFFLFFSFLPPFSLQEIPGSACVEVFERGVERGRNRTNTVVAGVAACGMEKCVYCKRGKGKLRERKKKTPFDFPFFPAHLRLLLRPEGEKDCEVRREVDPKGLPEREEKVGSRPDAPGVPGATGHPAEGRRGRLEVAGLAGRQRVRRTWRTCGAQNLAT